jgi:transitional endoplasmic reticulum ATPase
VDEDQIILPSDLKTSLLNYLDRFWKLRARAAELGISGRRGILLVGPAGCGKTLLVRHLLSRFPEARPHLFLAERVGGPKCGDPFSEMLETVRRSAQPAIVVLEDIDRLTESGVVTKEFLLNALDGMLSVGNWVLWIATSNDPRGLEENILNRPGRFDRVIVVPRPGPEERAALLRLHSPFDVSEDFLRMAAGRSDALTGAHIREACETAALEALENVSAYGPILLIEIQRLREQQAQSRGYQFDLGQQKAGFR